ncbi:hypothetical protein B0T20DRAFT_401912 [Sordaria brevicollis]|uniref:Uncharacterized protein n=1 Tax=Sordaria brevicollis TaxID=83679 RepID=A0AAE0UEQ3_SORBR|nr:hypothetical protein B0T20DRAFT_401912 [Sordaria brevicollis]
MGQQPPSKGAGKSDPSTRRPPPPRPYDRFNPDAQRPPPRQPPPAEFDINYRYPTLAEVLARTRLARERVVPPTIKDLLRATGLPNHGALSVVAQMLDEFPDLQAKAKHERDRFDKWVLSSNAESVYDEMRGKLECHADYQRIDELVTKLYLVGSDLKARVAMQLERPSKGNTMRFPGRDGGWYRQVTSYMADEDFAGMVLSKYQTVQKLIDECIAFKPSPVVEEEEEEEEKKVEGGLQLQISMRESRRPGVGDQKVGIKAEEEDEKKQKIKGEKKEERKVHVKIEKEE